MKTLLLWDIDCTLIDSGGAGERGLRFSLKHEFGIEDDFAWLEYFGRTDLWIARTILEHHFGRASAGEIRRFLDGYLKGLSQEMHNPRARVLPGVAEIVRHVASQPDIAQGLLTGNLQSGAQIKLSHLQLWSSFPFGAFADDAEDRNDLGPHALRRASSYHGRQFTPDQVFVIGDTPHDIACGKAVGARTIAVATGRYSLEQLRSHGPTAALHDLSDGPGFLSLLN
ncbi:MAG: haloacid dehalogenase-like hydrolase [Nibricoccus sp.]